MPHSPNPQPSNQRVNVLDANEFEEVLAIYKLTRMRIKRRQSERKLRLVFNRAVILERDVLVVNAVKKYEPVRHQNVESQDKKIINRLVA